LLILASATFSELRAQDTPPTGTNFKAVPTYSFKYYTPDSTVWMYKGSTYGWTNLTPDLSIYAPKDDPTFTTKITTPALNIPTSAAVNYVWKCTNATTGAGTWADMPGQVYKGTWNGATNTPTLANGTGTAGWFYRCTVGGTVDFGAGNITFSIGDDAYYNGTIWQRVPSGSASQWTTSGSDIYYNSGKVAIGAASGTDLLETSSTGNVYNRVISTNYGEAGVVLQRGIATDAYRDYRLYNWGGVFSIGYKSTGSYTDIFHLNGATGSVGIGTYDAKARLQVLSLAAAAQMTLGSATEAALALTVDVNPYGLFFGVNSTGKSWIQGGRADVATAYDISLQASGGNVAIGKVDATTMLDVNGVITATSGNSTNWNTAYTHSQIAGGNSVHVSTDENTQWDAAYSHSQIAGGTGVHVSATERTNWNTAYGWGNHASAGYLTTIPDNYLRNDGNDVTSGTLTATNFILSSDRRLKVNIKPISDLPKFRDIRFVQFNAKADKDQLRYGVIAQDVERVAPELVRTDAEGGKSVAYIDLLVAKIADLENRVAALEKRRIFKKY